MSTKPNSKKLHHWAARRRKPPAKSADEMVEVVPRRRAFWAWNRKVVAVTKGSRVHTSAKPRKNPIGPSIYVEFPGDVTPVQTIRMLQDVMQSISSGAGWPGEFTTGTLDRGTAAACLEIEKQELKRFRALMKAARTEVLYDLLVDPRGPMWTDLTDLELLQQDGIIGRPACG